MELKVMLIDDRPIHARTLERILAKRPVKWIPKIVDDPLIPTAVDSIVKHVLDSGNDFHLYLLDIDWFGAKLGGIDIWKRLVSRLGRQPAGRKLIVSGLGTSYIPEIRALAEKFEMPMELWDIDLFSETNQARLNAFLAQLEDELLGVASAPGTNC